MDKQVIRDALTLAIKTTSHGITACSCSVALAELNTPAPQSARDVAGTILDGIIRRIDQFFVSKDMHGAVTQGDDAFSPGDAYDIANAIQAYADSRVQEALETPKMECKHSILGIPNVT